MSGAGSFVKTGTGTTTFSGANTYTGTTTVSDGVLKITGSLSDTTAVTVSSGATFDVATSDTVGSIAGNGNILVGTGVTLTAGGLNTNTTFSGVMSGDGGFTKVGTGTTTFTGTNTYTGTTTISAGVLDIGGGGTSGTLGTGAVVTNGTLVFNRTDSVTVSNPISGTGGLTHVGTGTTTLSGANTYTGATTINAGTLRVTGSLADTTPVTVVSGATYNVATSDTVGSISGAGNIVVGTGVTLSAGGLNTNTTFSGVMSGDGGFTKVGTGTTTFTGANTYTGTTTISAGVLDIGGGGTSGTLGTGAVVTTGTLAFTRTDAVTISNPISGTGGFTKSGPGTTTLSGANTYTGPTAINGGTLRVTGSLADTTAVTVSTGATYNPASNDTVGSIAGTGTILIGTGITFTTGGLNTDTTFGGVMSGNGNYVKTGTGTTTFTGTNTYTGTTTITGGTLQVGSGGTTGTLGTNPGSITINGGTLAYNRSDDISVPNALVGTGNLAQRGTGSLTLSGPNTYTGTTAVDAGTLVADTPLTSSSGITVQAGATVSGTGALPATTVSGTTSPGDGVGVQTVTSDLTYATGSALRWQLTANDNAAANRGVNYDGINVVGRLSIGTGVTSELVFNGAGSTVDFTDAFWDSARSWVVYDNASVPTLSSATNIFDTVTITADSAGRALTAQSGLSNARFYWAQVGNDVVLHYSPGVSVTASTVSVSPTSVMADGTSTATVTIQARDPGGNPIPDPSLVISFAALGANQGTLTTPTFDAASGTYTATYTVGTFVGNVTITPRIYGTSFTNPTTILTVGDATAATSIATPAAGSLTADGSSTTTLTIQLKDARGSNLVRSGGTVTFAPLAAGQGTLGAVTDNNDGSYTVTYTAGTVAAPVTITPRLNGTPFTNTTTVTLTPGAPTVANSTAAPTAGSLTANGTATTTLTIQLKDAFGNNLTTSGGTVTFAPLATGQGSLGSVVNNNNGTYTVTYTAGTVAGPVTLTPRLDGTPFTTPTTVTLTPGAPTVANSTATPTTGSLTANGTATTTLSIQLKDAFGNNLTASGGTVTFAPLAAGQGTIGTVTDNGDGTYTAIYTAGTVAGSVTITPRLNGTAFTTPATLSLVPGPASVAASTVTAAPPSLTANGTATTTLTVVLKDAAGNRRTSSDGTVTFAPLGTDQGSIGQVTDNGDGSYTAIYTAGTYVGPLSITPRLDGVDFSVTLTLTLTAVNQTPVVTPVQIAYADTPASDTFAPTTGTLAAANPTQGATRRWGIQGEMISLGIASLVGRFGRLSVNTATGEYVYSPDARVINAISTDTNDTFTITADDGSLVGTATFTVALTGAVDTPTVLSVSGDQGASAGDRITNTGTLTVTGTADPGTTVKMIDLIGGQPVVVGTAIVGADGGFTLTGGPLADGQHALSIVSDSGATISGGAPLGLWTIDSVAPSTPTVTSPPTTGGLLTGRAEPGSIVTLSFAPQGSFPGGTYSVTADANGDWALDITTSPPIRGTAVPIPGGPFSLTAIVTDVAGNSSPATPAQAIRFDNSAPRITSPAVTGLLRPTFSGTAPASQTLRITVDGVVLGQTTSSSTGVWSFTPTADLRTGTLTVRVATIVSGSERAATEQSLLVDRTPPAVPTFVMPTVDNDPTMPLTGTGPVGSVIEVTIRRVGQTAPTVYRTMVGDDGAWKIDLGRTTPASGVLTSFADSDYLLTATAISPTGFSSAPVSQTLTIDTAIPAAPVLTIPTTTPSSTPSLTGIGEPGSIVRVTIDDAVFEKTVGTNGSWAIDIATDRTTDGMLITLNDGVHVMRATVTDPAGNVSPEAMQFLRVTTTTGQEPPQVLAATASFGDAIDSLDLARPATVMFALAGIADGQQASLALGGRTYTAVVSGGVATFTVPPADLAALPQGTVPYSVSVASNPPLYTSSFSVDTVGPSRPQFGQITSTTSDQTPGDQFTGVTRPTVVFTGEPGQTPVLRGAAGPVDPATYTFTESPAGRYTIVLLAPLATGEYHVNLRDANGNESGNGTGTAARNFFRIDSVPVLYDQTARRQAIGSRVYGKLGVINSLAGVEFPVTPAADGTWTDLDGERLTMGIIGGAPQIVGGRTVAMTTSVNGASLSVQTDTGAYTYTPLAGTTRLDRFSLFLRDESGNETQFVLSFDSRDYLDRDGVPQTTENRLSGHGGDRNGDGRVDARQNSVTTLAWGAQPNFAAALNPATIANVDPRTISTMVVNTRPLQGPSVLNFGSLNDLMRDVDPLAQLLDVGVVAPGTLSASSPVTGGFSTVRWDAMKYSVESLASRGLQDIMPGRAGTQIQVSFDVSAAGMLTRGGTGGAAALTAARKFVSATTISQYTTVGVSLRDLDGNVITRSGWYDFTARDRNNDGIYDTDGVIFVDFQLPGQPGSGIVDAVVVILTDNAFGDDDPTLHRVVDPFLPGMGNAAPTLAGAGVSYVNTPMYDAFSAATGTLAAADADRDAVSFGIVGAAMRKRVATATNSMGTLSVDTRTGRWTFLPNVVALNQAVGTVSTTFTTTVSDGRLTTTSAFTVNVSAATMITSSFSVGTAAPGTPGNVITALQSMGQAGVRRTLPSQQEYVEFTLQGPHGGLTLDDLQFYANDRLISLRTARLVKIAEVNGSVTYRLLGLSRISSARARYVLSITSAGGWAATTWSRG
ncbi:MAG: invasin domain 3-containing protein [Planctomycetota bacterium]